jgi:hypothetical protein
MRKYPAPPMVTTIGIFEVNLQKIISNLELKKHDEIKALWQQITKNIHQIEREYKPIAVENFFQAYTNYFHQIVVAMLQDPQEFHLELPEALNMLNRLDRHLTRQTMLDPQNKRALFSAISHSDNINTIYLDLAFLENIEPELLRELFKEDTVRKNIFAQVTKSAKSTVANRDNVINVLNIIEKTAKDFYREIYREIIGDFNQGDYDPANKDRVSERFVMLNSLCHFSYYLQKDVGVDKTILDAMFGDIGELDFSNHRLIELLQFTNYAYPEYTREILEKKFKDYPTTKDQTANFIALLFYVVNNATINQQVVADIVTCNQQFIDNLKESVKKKDFIQEVLGLLKIDYKTNPLGIFSLFNVINSLDPVFIEQDPSDPASANPKIIQNLLKYNQNFIQEIANYLFQRNPDIVVKFIQRIHKINPKVAQDLIKDNTRFIQERTYQYLHPTHGSPKVQEFISFTLFISKISPEVAKTILWKNQEFLLRRLSYSNEPYGMDYFVCLVEFMHKINPALTKEIINFVGFNGAQRNLLQQAVYNYWEIVIYNDVIAIDPDNKHPKRATFDQFAADIKKAIDQKLPKEKMPQPSESVTSSQFRPNSENCQLEIIKTLIRLGADIKAVDKEGKTPEQYATDLAKSSEKFLSNQRDIRILQEKKLQQVIKDAKQFHSQIFSLPEQPKSRSVGEKFRLQDQRLEDVKKPSIFLPIDEQKQVEAPTDQRITGQEPQRPTAINIIEDYFQPPSPSTQTSAAVNIGNSKKPTPKHKFWR